MQQSDTKRISRLTAILTQLQAKRLLTASELANRFSVSTRTIYRDIKTLEQAGVPVVTEDGRGYCITEYYRLPPVMFTEGEANALITAEQLVLKNKDDSFVREFTEAIAKVKADMRNSIKDKASLLSERIQILKNDDNTRTSSHLTALQFALTNFRLTALTYTNEASNTTNRIVEPFGLLYSRENWLLLGWCRLRNEYRFFRLDRIEKMEVLSEKFKPHEMTLQEYFQRYY